MKRKNINELAKWLNSNKSFNIDFGGDCGIDCFVAPNNTRWVGVTMFPEEYKYVAVDDALEALIEIIDEGGFSEVEEYFFISERNIDEYDVPWVH